MELEEELVTDSIDVAEWVWKWEEEFGVKVDMERVAERQTLADLIGYLISLHDRDSP
jgi:acyl carrier protein